MLANGNYQLSCNVFPVKIDSASPHGAEYLFFLNHFKNQYFEIHIFETTIIKRKKKDTTSPIKGEGEKGGGGFIERKSEAKHQLDSLSQIRTGKVSP